MDAAEAAATAPAGTRTGARPETLSERLRRGDLLDPACPSREVLKHLTSRWGVLVLLALEIGGEVEDGEDAKGAPIRFAALRRRIGGVSERMLAHTLTLLERDGLVRRVAYPVVPPHVEYSLTPLGEEAAGRVRDLADWIEGALPAIAAGWALRDQRDDPAENGAATLEIAEGRAERECQA